MNNLKAVSLVTQLTSESSPSIKEIVELFLGLQTRLSLRNFVRVFYNRYSDSPLEPGTKPSRFSFSELNPPENDHQVKVTYGAQTIDTAIYETVVRSKFDINPNRIIDSKDYAERSAIVFSSKSNEKLNLLDLTNGRATCFGVPTDVIRSSDHKEGQHFSQFVYENMSEVEGFIYSSRYTEEKCVALYYDRAIAKLNVFTQFRLSRTSTTIAMLSKNIQVA